MLSFWKSHQNFYRMHITTLLFPYCLPIRSSEFLTGNLVDIHPPDLDVQDSRTTIGKRTVGVLFHQDIERLDFLVVILFKNDISPTDNAAGPHPVTARHLYILIGQFGCRTKNSDKPVPLSDKKKYKHADSGSRSKCFCLPEPNANKANRLCSQNSSGSHTVFHLYPPSLQNKYYIVPIQIQSARCQHVPVSSYTID